jgi:rfaE bifunctional protein nucleotidyltransferase chain/domain
MIIDIRSQEDLSFLKIALGGMTSRSIGLTSGCYDLLHNLHLSYLQRCRRLCDILLVGVDSDDLVRRTKGPERPVIPEHQRVAMVAALRCVDVAFVMGSLLDFETAVDSFKPKYIFKNQSFRPQDVIGADAAEIVTVPDVFQADSTSGIIEEIKRAKSRHRDWFDTPGGSPDTAVGPAASTPSATPASEPPPCEATRASRIG